MTTVEINYIRPAYISELDNYYLYSLEKIPLDFYKDFSPMLICDEKEKNVICFPKRDSKNEKLVIMENYIGNLLFLPEEERKCVETYKKTLLYGIVLNNFQCGIKFLTKYDFEYLEFFKSRDTGNAEFYGKISYDFLINLNIDYDLLISRNSIDEYHKFVLLKFCEKFCEKYFRNFK